MEMQEQGAMNMTYDEVHEVENANEQKDYRGPVTRSRTRAQDHIDSSMGETFNQDERISEEGLPILIHIERFEGGLILGTFLQRELIAEIINGCVQEYPVAIDALNEYKCVINMPKEMITRVVAQEIQNMTHWGGVCANIQCTIASHSKLRSIATERDRNQAEREQEASASQQVSAQPSNEEMMSRLLTGILNTVDEKLKALSD